MTEPGNGYFDRQSAAIVETFLRRELLDPEIDVRVERLHAEDRSGEALRLIIAHRRNGSVE